MWYIYLAPRLDLTVSFHHEHSIVPISCPWVSHRVQVFELSGKFVTKFGSEGSGRGELKNPFSTAILSDGRIVVCEFNNNRIQVFEHS